MTTQLVDMLYLRICNDKFVQIVSQYTISLSVHDTEIMHDLVLIVSHGFPLLSRFNAYQVVCVVQV